MPAAGDALNGDKYVIAGRDQKTGFVFHFCAESREQAGIKLLKRIEEVRRDPEVNCPGFCTVLILDPEQPLAAERSVEVVLQPPAASLPTHHIASEPCFSALQEGSRRENSATIPARWLRPRRRPGGITIPTEGATV